MTMDNTHQSIPSGTRVGTCSVCGGDVYGHRGPWFGVVPPSNDECKQCGAVGAWQSDIVPMQPNPYRPHMPPSQPRWYRYQYGPAFDPSNQLIPATGNPPITPWGRPGEPRTSCALPKNYSLMKGASDSAANHLIPFEQYFGWGDCEPDPMSNERK